MAKKIYLVDSTGYEFFICEFEGMGSDNRPRLTIMTPGRPVENFLTHLDYYGEDSKDYYLFGEEGKQVDATLVVEMMGQIILRDMNNFSRMAARMELMRKNGISYSREMQKVTIMVLEGKDHETGDVTYRANMYIGEELHFVSESDNYESIGDIMLILRNFFCFVEDQMHIPLRKRLEVPASLKNSCKRYCPSLFDEIG